MQLPKNCGHEGQTASSPFFLLSFLVFIFACLCVCVCVCVLCCYCCCFVCWLLWLTVCLFARLFIKRLFVFSNNFFVQKSIFWRVYKMDINLSPVYSSQGRMLQGSAMCWVAAVRAWHPYPIASQPSSSPALPSSELTSVSSLAPLSKHAAQRPKKSQLNSLLNRNPGMKRKNLKQAVFPS